MAANASSSSREDALWTLALSRDRRHADLALDRLRDAGCDERRSSEAAAVAVAWLATPDRAVPALAAQLDCPATLPRWHAVQALGQIDLPAARAALVAQWHVETDAEARRLIEEAVGQILPAKQVR